jgi:hypothetical protein
MKPLSSFLLALALLCVVSESTAQSSPTTSSSEPKFELPETGKNVAREKGGWLNAEASGTRLVINFFDAEKKPMPPDVVRGFVRFRSPGKNNEDAPLFLERETLTTPATVRPPHNFLVILSLFTGEGEDSAESHTFKYP